MTDPSSLGGTAVPGGNPDAASGAVGDPSSVPVGTAGADATEAETEAETKESGRAHGWARTLLEWVVVLLVALVVALFVRSYVVQTYFIPSSSMEPTLLPGEHILVFKAAYRFTSPAIGDIIVFRAPPAEHSRCADPTIQDLVKRILAVPGDTISSQGNKILIDGKVLAQPWQHTAELGEQIRTQTIPPNQYFVMGDNRPDSCDSRVWGTVPRANIIGKAILIFWPLSHLSTL